MTLIMNLQILQQDDQNKTEYGEGNENDSSIKFETNIIKLFLCDYSDVILWFLIDYSNKGERNSHRKYFLPRVNI